MSPTFVPVVRTVASKARRRHLGWLIGMMTVRLTLRMMVWARGWKMRMVVTSAETTHPLLFLLLTIPVLVLELKPGKYRGHPT